MRISASVLETAVCRTLEHARTASEVLGTEGFLAYFEDAKVDGDPDAIDLINRLAVGFNEMMAPPAPPDSIASVRLIPPISPYSLLTCNFSDASGHRTGRGRRDGLESPKGKRPFRSSFPLIANPPSFVLAHSRDSGCQEAANKGSPLRVPRRPRRRRGGQQLGDGFIPVVGPSGRRALCFVFLFLLRLRVRDTLPHTSN